MKTEIPEVLPSTPKKRKASSTPASPSSPRKRAWTLDDKVRFLLYMLAAYGHKNLSGDHKRGLAAVLDRSERSIEDFHRAVIKADMNRLIQEMDDKADI